MASDLQNKNLSESITLKDNRPPSAERKPNMEDPNNSTIHWFAQIGESGSNEVADRNREEKLRIAKERQSDERQRKIEELRAQAEAAQRFREQKEEERRRRIDELRSRDNEKRHQVEERKRAIMEAEKERREYIMKKNLERSARLETKKRNEKSSIVFAFGSSTPRLLDPADMVSVSPGSYWGNRRSTSISNVAYSGPTLSRRSSERELSDGSKKRATSAGGIDRHNDGSRSGDVTPGGSVNPSRPGSAMSTSTTASSLVQRRAMPIPRKPRPASIAGTGVTLIDEHKQKKDKPPIPKTHSTHTPKRTSLSNSSSITKLSSSAEKRSTPTKKEPIPTPKSATPNAKNSTSAKPVPTNNQTPVKTPISKKTPSATNQQQSVIEKQYEVTVKEEFVQKNQEQNSHEQQQKMVQDIQSKAEKDAINIEKIDTIEIVEIVPNTDGHSTSVVEITNTETGFETIVNGDVSEFVATKTNATITNYTSSSIEEIESPEEKADKDTEKEQNIREKSIERQQQLQQPQDNEMTASMIRKITTEDEAKAALAERRRLAREEAERQAELERQRIEVERKEELRRQAEEEERQRQFEEEATRLAVEQRKAEEQRLQQAIEEARKREEEDRLKREEEEKQKAEREESERKAKEEAEKQRIEVAERLKREEKEREERRKRVEAIMSRTRKAGGGGATPNSTPTKENNGESKTDEQKMTDEKVASNNINDNQEQEQPELQQNPAEEQPTEQQIDTENYSNNPFVEVTMSDNNSSITTSSNNISDETNNSDNNVIINTTIETVVPELDNKTDITTTTTTSIPTREVTTGINNENNKTQAQQSSYEQSVTDKENALIKNFSNMIMDQQQNVKNLQQNLIENLQNNPFVEVTNGTTTTTTTTNELISQTIANGNGHIENMNNKNDAKSLVDVTSDQLIDFGSESQQISNDAVNFNNNNLLTSSTTLVTADSHENKEISLL